MEFVECIDRDKENIAQVKSCFPDFSGDYTDLAEYLRAWPDKLAAFVCDRLCDDDMAFFVAELYEYICWSDRNGPGFEEWRRT